MAHSRSGNGKKRKTYQFLWFCGRDARCMKWVVAKVRLRDVNGYLTHSLIDIFISYVVETKEEKVQ